MSRIFGAVCQNGYVVRDIRSAPGADFGRSAEVGHSDVRR